MWTGRCADALMTLCITSTLAWTQTQNGYTALGKRQPWDQFTVESNHVILTKLTFVAIIIMPGVRHYTRTWTG